MNIPTDPVNAENLVLPLPRRRTLLPWWVKIFAWLFMVLGAIAVLGIPFAAMGFKYAISLYGLETTDPFSLLGVFLVAVFLFKGVTAFCLWTEKDIALKLAWIDAWMGIATCAYMMLINPFMQPGFVVSLRLELVLLIPYLLWIRKVRPNW